MHANHFREKHSRFLTPLQIQASSFRRFILAVILGSITLALAACQPAPAPVLPSPASLTPTEEPLSVWVDESTPLDQFYPEAVFTVHFNKPMQPDSTIPAVVTVPVLEGRVKWNEDATRLTFTPLEGFNPRQDYVIALSRELRAATGASFDRPLKWEIQVLTSKPATTIAPRVIRRLTPQVSPDRTVEFGLAFSRPMDPKSVAAAIKVNPPLQLDLRWQENTLYIQTLEPLLPGQSYHFSLADSATAADGVPLTREIVWDHKPKDLLARAGYPTLADPAAPLSLRFNYRIEPASLWESIRLEPAVEGDWDWDPDSLSAEFHPVEPFSTWTNYNLRFSAPLLDPEGNTLPAPEPVVFTTPPPVRSLFPSDGNSANPATNVRIVFDRPVDHASAEAAFHLYPQVEGELSWEGDDTLIFTPKSGFLAETSAYTVTLEAGLSAADGTVLFNSPYSWNFSTGRYQLAARFGAYGPNAQVLDAGGRRALQVVLQQTGSVSLQFSMYRLDLEQFLDRYSSGFRGVEGWQLRALSTEGAGLAYSWEESLSPGAKSQVQEVILPAEVQPGLYILEMSAGPVGDQLILLLTHYSIVVKQAEGQLVTWVTDINGGPVPGAQVGVYARDAEELAAGETDGQGIFRTEVPRDPEPLIVVARYNGETTASGLSPEWISPSGSWGWWWGPPPAARDFSAFVFTDRPIYRPGQTVYFKAMLREDADAILSLPEAGLPVTVRIRDARDNVVLTEEQNVNQFGTLSGEFQLAGGAMLGNYAVEVSLDGETFRQVFKVQDYRKPDIQLSVAADAGRHVVGDTITVTVDARYFFGEPVAGADLTIRQYTLGDPYAWYYPEDFPTTWFETDRPLIQGKTGQDGRYTFTLPAQLSGWADENQYWDEWGSSLRQTRWGIEVTVDDGSRQTVSAAAVVQVLNAAETLSLETGDYLQVPGKPFDVSVRATDLLEQPVAGRALALSLRRWDEGVGRYDREVASWELETGEEGTAVQQLTAPVPGYYQLRLEGEDGRGNPIRCVTYLYIFQDAARWIDERARGLSISADKDSYATGEIARLVVESPVGGPTLLTFERGNTRRAQVVRITPPMTVLEVPIREDYAPNIYVNLSLWQPQDTDLLAQPYPEIYSSLTDSELLMADLNLSVPVTGKRLQVEILPDQPDYAPREEAIFTLRVSDEAGEPVDAEVALAMVDESIFSLSEDLSGPIFDAFYGERADVVRSYDSMALRRSLWDIGGWGGGGDGGGLSGPRRDFPDTAAWLPGLRTGNDGQVTVRLAMPDSLTAWRLTARAITAGDTQVGEAQAKVTTRQPVVIRPVLPRNLVAGDRAGLSALLHNFSEDTLDLELSIQAENLDVLGEPDHGLSLGPGESRLLGWGVAAARAGEAKLTFEARVGDEVLDAVQVSLPIRPLAVPEVEVQVGEVARRLDTSLAWPEDALELSTVTVEISRSIAGSLLTGLEYLTGFPYGCVEQTMSKALPNAVVGRAFHRLGVDNPTLQAELPAQINAGLQKLYGYQHNDGGWGWWYDDATDAYQTAWVVFGLSVTAQAGYEVDPKVIERGATWLAENLDAMDPRIRAFALYSLSLAGHGDRVASLALVEGAGELDGFSQAALALALHELGEGDTARQVLALLLEEAESDAGEVHWEGHTGDGEYDSKVMASSIRTTALALSALVRIHPDHPYEAGAVRWLMDQRQASGWGTTNETSFAILALTDHLLATEVGSAESPYTVSLNGKPLAVGTLGRGEPAAIVTVPASALRAGDNDLQIESDGAGRLYYRIVSRIFREQAEVPAAGQIEVHRVYLDPRSDRPLARVSPGELVKVQLEVVLPEKGAYLIVEDKLPGGLEALNESLNTSSHEGNLYEEPHSYWQEYGYNYKEVHAGRVSFFITELAAGSHTYTYLARATHAGTFVALPAEVSAMYDPGLWGRSASQPFVVTSDTSE